MIKFVFIVLGWMCFGKFLMERVCGLYYYDMFDDWVSEHNLKNEDAGLGPIKHIFVQMIVYLIVPPICIVTWAELAINALKH